MASMLNLGSFLFGLAALILPFSVLARRDKTGCGRCAVLSAASVGACAAALCMQLFYTDHLVRIEDWSALLDTAHTVAWVSAALLLATLALNAAALAVCFRRRKRLQDAAHPAEKRE